MGPLIELLAALKASEHQATADLETINEWRGVYRHADDGIVSAVIARLGIEGAFTPEALAVMAEEYRRIERRHEARQTHTQEAAHG